MSSREFNPWDNDYSPDGDKINVDKITIAKLNRDRLKRDNEDLKEKLFRLEHPAVQDAWEQYQITIKLVKK